MDKATFTEIDSWKTRVGPAFNMISPGGEEISAKWIGDSVSKTRRAQRDAFPLRSGEYGKDLGGNSDDFTSTIYFDGPNCDKDAQKFSSAAADVGEWKVTHPVKGEKTLILISIKEAVEPVRSGGIVEFETTWFEPIDLTALGVTHDLTSLVAGLASSAVVVTASAFGLDTFTSGWGAISSVLAMASIIENIVYKAVNGTSWLISLSTSAANIAKDRWDESRNDLTNEISETELDTDNFDPAAISTALSGIMMATAYGNTDSDKVLSNMESAATNMIAALPSGSSHTGTDSANRSYTVQTALEGAVIATCYGLSYGDRQARTEAIDAAARLRDLFESVVNALDDVADTFSGLRADRQYYSQTETYAMLWNLVSQTTKMLQRQIFDLAVEKIWTLAEDSTPIRICFEEYGAKGEEYIDQFIEWNQLEGDEIQLLSAGTEVRVYLEVA